MNNNKLTYHSQTRSSAATNPNKFSAKEVGEMINTHPGKLFRVDIGLCTDWYTNDEYMEEIISYIEDEKNMELLIKYILLKQEQQTCVEHHPKVCCRVTDDRKYAPFVADLSSKLDAMRVRELHRREIGAKLKEMEEMWSSSITDDSIDNDKQSVANTLTNKTTPPIFKEKSEGVAPQYHIADLPQDVQNHILLSDDKTYSLFVNTLKGPVKKWIDKKRLQDWNVVRFICRLRGIVTTKCSLNIFGLFLEKIGLGNQENNMKQRQDANDRNALIAYAAQKRDTFWQLRKDGKEVEELLADVIESIAA